MEGNFYARQVAVDYNCDVVDLHYVFRNHLRHRVADGVHWDPFAHRRISNMLLTHICEAWSLPLPGRIRHNYPFQVGFIPLSQVATYVRHGVCLYWAVLDITISSR